MVVRGQVSSVSQLCVVVELYAGKALKDRSTFRIPNRFPSNVRGPIQAEHRCQAFPRGLPNRSVNVLHQLSQEGTSRFKELAGLANTGSLNRIHQASRTNGFQHFPASHRSISGLGKHASSPRGVQTPRLTGPRRPRADLIARESRRR